MVCVFSVRIQQEMLLDWFKKEVFCLEEKVGQHWDRKPEQDARLSGRGFARSL